MKRKILAVVGLTLVLGIGCAIGVMAEATQIIRMDDREKEFAQMGSDGLVKASWEEEAPQVIKMWGPVLEVGELFLPAPVYRAGGVFRRGDCPH